MTLNTTCPTQWLLFSRFFVTLHRQSFHMLQLRTHASPDMELQKIRSFSSITMSSTPTRNIGKNLKNSYQNDFWKRFLHTKSIKMPRWTRQISHASKRTFRTFYLFQLVRGHALDKISFAATRSCLSQTFFRILTWQLWRAKKSNSIHLV